MNQRFSINSIALGNIRRRRGNYLLLILGIVLAIYFVAAALLFADTMFTSLREQHYNRLGEQDAIVFNCGGAPLEELLSNGIFSEYGTAEILGCVLPDGKSRENSFSIARFDQAARELVCRKPLEGRLPEKAGEIALERSMLTRLRSNARLGDRLTLTLAIPDGTAFLEQPVEKSYTLVGILADKYIYFNLWGNAFPAYRDYPAGVLAAQEVIEPGGKEVLNCYGNYGRGAGKPFERLDRFLQEHEIIGEYGWSALEQTRYQLFGGYHGVDYDAGRQSITATSIFFMIIFFVLVGAACLGIINSFSSNLESRRRQIGLIRAVGATKNQIGRIFGREAFLLSLISIPPGLALAMLTVWGITRMLGDSYHFQPNLPVLAAVAAAGLLCVMPAASIPLRKACRIPPLQAIRNTALTRKMKHSRLPSKTSFDLPRLIAGRQRILYKGKQAGITSMLAISIVLLSLVSLVATPLLGEAAHDYGHDYALRKERDSFDWMVENDLHRPGITEQDRAEAAALPGVKMVSGEKILRVKLLMDRITPYILNSGFWRFDYLTPEPEDSLAGENSGLDTWHLKQYQNYLASKSKYGYAKDYLTVDCCGADEALLKNLAPFVSAGSINIDKLNAGEEILLIAPQTYGRYEEIDKDKNWFGRIDYQLDPKLEYQIYHNDMFQAGDTLALSLLYNDNPDAIPEGVIEYLPDQVVRIDRTVTVGALLEPQGGGRKYLQSSFASFFHPEAGNILTTNAGLKALGFEVPYNALAITLSENPDEALEEYLESGLQGIAARTTGVSLISNLALTRESREMAFGLLVAAGAVLLLFFAICASMINNTLSARLRAGRPGIGTLRAVGASWREIARFHLWQLISVFAWGTAAGLAAGLSLCGWMLAKNIIPSEIEASLPLWEPLLFVAPLFAICYLSLRAKVGAVFRGSIVENIREL